MLFFGDEVETGRQRLFQDQEPLITKLNKRLKVNLKRSNVCLKMEWWRLDADGNPKMDDRVPDAITTDHSMSNANAYIPILKDLRDKFKVQLVQSSAR